jgi:hypothetical protein
MRASACIGLFFAAAACGTAEGQGNADTDADTDASSEGEGDDDGSSGPVDGDATDVGDGMDGPEGDGGSTTGDDTGATTGEPIDPEDDAPRYDAVQQKSTHNSYQRHEAIVDQLVYHRVRSIELDIHVGKTFEDTIPGDWFVYHTDITDDETSCRRLSDCLQEIVVFAEAVPEHEVVTLLVDLKDDWADAHGPADLDVVLQSTLGDSLFSPDDLRAACPGAADLASAVRDPACGWPRLPDLRGRVIVALTGGGVNGATSKLSTYLAEGERAFVMPDAAGSPSLDAPHSGVAMYNASAEELDAAQAVVDAGFVARVWDLNEASAWSDAMDRGVHHLATDKVNAAEDAWAATHAQDGWPFSCPGGCEGAGPEPGSIVGIEVDSGDLWGTSDDAWFQHEDRSAGPEAEWTVLVSSVNSHVEPFAKGCLMARAGLAANAPYMAVCRPADEEPLRAQLRATPGAESEAIEHDIAASGTVAPSSVAWLRLVVDDTGTCATAYGARRFGAWVQIASHCFDEPLTHQGLAASSHDAGVVRMLFVDPREGGDEVALGELTGTAVGSASAMAFAGPMP